ncbi:cystathionine gamma-synthase family protein [Flavobacterium sp. ov086]|uniref:cystathionine gamma-synthase family protein n=1 Tax=Flavobacterium sp. ov086 TaxID=1761785 RepID=UPI000B71541A|nr:cystathionine gamma-synthase family protein [Flavobacterium sp. ov086]SNR42181.1 O-acetylhomoserine (thiol)-lyase [Flavobacterium sp. ov086]
MNNKKGFTTTILHSDRLLQPEFGALHQPIHTAVTWGYEDVNGLVDVFQNKTRGYAYSRQGNPTVAALEQKVTQMEEGLSTVAFSTGMAAITSSILSLLKKDDHIIASSYLFGNSRSIMQTFIEIGIQISFVDGTDIENIKKAYKPDTRMVFVETIANPGTQVADLEEIGNYCSEHKLIYVVDNTMTSPYIFKPINVKASLIINSLTKYIGGHGNALGGSITDTGLYDWENFPNIAPVLRSQIPPALLGISQIRKRGLRDGGGTLSPEAAHSISVGSETLALRLERTCSNALILAHFLKEHTLVKKVNYPGLASHPQHKIASDLFRGYGGLMSFELSDKIDCLTFLNRLKVVIKSSNLGDTRSLAIPVAKTIFHELGAEQRKEMGIDDSLIRLSVGIEDIEDLLEDFTQALY